MAREVGGDDLIRPIPELFFNDRLVVAVVRFAGIVDFPFVERILDDLGDRLFAPDEVLGSRDIVVDHVLSDIGQGLIVRGQFKYPLDERGDLLIKDDLVRLAAVREGSAVRDLFVSERRFSRNPAALSGPGDGGCLDAFACQFALKSREQADDPDDHAADGGRAVQVLADRKEVDLVGLEQVDHTVKVPGVPCEAVKAEEDDRVKGLLGLDIFKDGLDAGAVQVFARVSVIVDHSFLAKVRQFVAEGVDHVLAVMGLGVQGGVIALRLVIG